jgi:chaperonin GroES
VRGTNPSADIDRGAYVAGPNDGVLEPRVPASIASIKGDSNMTIRPLQDRLIIRRVKEEEKSKGGIIIPDTAKEKPTEGEVMAVGNGKVLENGTVCALDVKVGDRVLFGKYDGNEVKLDGEDRLIIRESDVLGVLQA